MFKKTLAIAIIFILIMSAGVTATPSDWALDEVTRAVIADLVPKRIQGNHQDAITREEFCEMAVLLYEKISKNVITPESHFTDTANESVNKAYALGIVNGTGTDVFSPNNAITRQEICTMLTRTYKLIKPEVIIPEKLPNSFPDIGSIADWALNSVQFMNLCTIMLGDEYGNINPLGNTTREQAMLLVYRLFLSSSVNAMDYLMSLMGGGSNTHDNMINGGFATYCSDGNIYYSDGKGIKSLGSNAYILYSEGIKNFEIYSDMIYYIGNDGYIYSYDRGSGNTSKLTQKTAESFLSTGNKIYYKDGSSGNIDILNLSDDSVTAFTGANAGLPVFTNSVFHYSDNNSIIKAGEQGNEVIYSGGNSRLSFNNDKLYFINDKGFVSSINFDGSEYKVIAEKEVIQYSFTSSCIVALDKNGHVFKMDYSGKYFIMIDTESYDDINTYQSLVFARKADGTINTFRTDATDKTKIN